MNNQSTKAILVILIIPLLAMFLIVQNLTAASQRVEANIVSVDEESSEGSTEPPFFYRGYKNGALDLTSADFALTLFDVQAVDDLSVTKTASPDPAVAGQLLTYTIVVNNSGPSTATNVQVRDELPKAGIKLVNTFPAGECVKNKGHYLCTAASIAPGAAHTFTLVVSVPSDKDGEIIANTATLEASNPPDSDPSNNSSIVQTLITRRVDLSIEKIGSPDPVPAGGLLNYTINVTNAGPSDASGVIINDILPAGTTFFSSAECSSVNNEVVCNIGTVVAGGTSSVLIVVQVDPTLPDGFQINNTASVSSNETDVNQTNNSTTETTTVTNTGEQEADVAISKIATPDPVIAGTNLTYLLTVMNSGPAFATGIVVTDTLPAEATFLSAETSWGDACSSTGPIVCTLAGLGVGASEKITIVATVGAGVSGSINNVSTVSAQQIDPQIQNNQATLSTNVIQPGEFPFLKLDLPDPVTAGRNLTYTLQIASAGRPSLSNVVLTDTLPSEVTFINVDQSLGSCSHSTGVVTCDLGDLPVGIEASVQILAHVDPAAVGQIVNTATVDANEITETQAEQNTTIVSSADLMIDLIEFPNPVVAGKNMTYTIHALNDGPSLAKQAVVNATLPAGVTFISSPDCSLVGLTVACNLGDIVPGGMASAAILAYVAPNVIGSISTIATVFGNTNDPDPSNNSIVSGVSVIAEADLAVGASTAPNEVVAGANLTYTLVLTNDGPSDAPSVILTDTLPTQVTLVAASAGPGATCGGTTVVHCSLGVIPAGTQKVVTILVVVDSSATGTLSNGVRVASDGIDLNTGNNVLMLVTPTKAEADLTLSKTDGQDPVAAGNIVSYLLTVRNRGLSDATGVVVTDALPAELTLISATLSQGGPCSNSTPVVCPIGTIAADDDATVTIFAKLDSGQKVAVQNNAEVGCQTFDTNASNNQDSEQTEVILATDLILSVSSVPNPVAPGELLTYSLLVNNGGPSDATAVKVVDDLPAQVQFISAASDPAAVCTGQTTITCQLGNLKAGSSATVKIKVRVASLFTGTLMNIASVEGAESDPDPLNNGQEEMTAVVERKAQILLPAIYHSYVPGEPNDTCEEAHWVALNTPYHFLPDDAFDWYKFDLPSSGVLVVELTDFVPKDGQLAVFRGSSCASRELVGNKGDLGTVKTLNLGVQPAGHYMIFVSNDGKFTDILPYRLRVNFSG